MFISAAHHLADGLARLQGLGHGRFIDGLNKAGIEVDRKVLSNMAITQVGWDARKFLELKRYLDAWGDWKSPWA